MRRPLAALSLALLVVFALVGPAAATEPSSPPAATVPSAEPSAEPTVDPAATPTPNGDAEGPLDATNRFIVMLRNGADTAAVAGRHRTREGTRTIRTFNKAFRGFTAKLDQEQRQAMLADPNVLAVVPDEIIKMAAQTTPNGIARVGGPLSPAAAINGLDERVDADVAIIDTGVSPHPDLNLVGGYNCASSDPAAWQDVEGHGTHVAGTVGALDNDFGVVGVAPGARIWSVRILNSAGEGLLSWYVCGLDWILAQRDPTDASRPLFEAVNMSVRKLGSDDGACGTVNNDILHAAICRVVAAGVTVVAAASNESTSATRYVPAAYDEVITVSALADSDGQPGGIGGNGCYSWGGYDQDDTFADFSNYGFDVDIMASGKCIWSTLRSGSYGYSSGTSMAAPAVSGAVALYKSTRPAATPAQVKEALQYLGNFNWATSTDPDGSPDKLLDVSYLGGLGSFALTGEVTTVKTTGAAETVSIPVTIDRSPTYFERVGFSVTNLPVGWAATWSPSSLIGFGERSTSLAIGVPAGAWPGTYEIGITALGLGSAGAKSAFVVVGGGNGWNPVTPVRVLDTRIALGASGRFRDEQPRTFTAAVGEIPADAVAVTGNLTVTGATEAGYVAIGPVMTSVPTTSNINFTKGQTLANGITVQLGAGGTLSAVFGGPAGTGAHVILDVTGYYRADGGATWYGTEPTRLLDTRTDNGLKNAFEVRVVRRLPLAGRNPVPVGAVAVTANVTVTGATAAGYLAIAPSLTKSPTTSTLNFPKGGTLANNLTLPLGGDGKVSAVVVGPAGMTTHVIMDVTGYFMAGAGGARWYPIAPSRQLDTRVGLTLAGRFLDGTPRTFGVIAVGAVAPDAVAITGNLTVARGDGGGYVSAGPTMIAKPATSSINFSKGQVLANGITLRLAPGGLAAAVFQGPTGTGVHLVLDIVGYFR